MQTVNIIQNIKTVIQYSISILIICPVAFCQQPTNTQLSILSTQPPPFVESTIVVDAQNQPKPITKNREAVLPQALFTYKPEAGPIPAIEIVGTIGKFIWHDGCLLFSPYKKDDLVTPIFHTNSITGYQFNAVGNDALIRQYQYKVTLNEWHYIRETASRPEDDRRTTRIVSRGDEKCLMEYVLFLPDYVHEAESN